jgi:hypothetical protein
MPNSTRGNARGGMRAGFEYIDRRHMGPWVALRPLFRGGAFLITLVAFVVATIMLKLNPYAMGGVFVILFLGSFAITWQIIGLVIRSRAVLLVATVAAVGNLWFQAQLGGVVGNLLFVALVAGLLLFPPTGTYLIARFWCVLDRHRMRACLKVCKIRTMNLDGSLPLMLWARPTKTGEKVWLWVRAGASGDDIEDALSYIAPACFAMDARMERVRKLATVVKVEIIRRDPLASSDAIPSPLSRLTTLVKDKIAGEGTEAIRAASVDDITSADPAPLVPLPRKNTTRKTTAEPKSAEPTKGPVVVSGEDLSDYID